MAKIEQTYYVRGKEISVVECENSGAGRKGRKGIYLDGKTYVLKDNSDASERTVKEIGANADEWCRRSYDIHNGLWNVTLATLSQTLLGLLRF